MFPFVIAIQAMLVATFAIKLKQLREIQSKWGKPLNGRWPAAEIILCLRGADETLLPLLNALYNQNYPGKIRLQIIVDSRSDNSWKIVEKAINQYAINKTSSPDKLEITLQALQKRQKNGSLKCSSINQALRNLHPDSKVIALVDADAVVPKNWLKLLVLGCCQKGIGAVSGNRWYLPSQNTIEGYIRTVWNAGALVLMTLFKIPWGGSLAVRREVVDSGLWIKLMNNSLCEDTCLNKPLKQLKMKYLFIPELLIIDKSDGIKISDLSNWLTRQVLTVRLHHPAWPLILIHGISTTTLICLGILFNTLSSLLAYELACLFLLTWIEKLALNKKTTSIKNFALALFPGQILNGLSTFSALLAKKVEWRGINYQITLKPKGVQILND